MNDPKLKLAMARLLPEEIQISQCQCGYKSCYSLHNGGICINWIENEESILETEWPQLCEALLRVTGKWKE